MAMLKVIVRAFSHKHTHSKKRTEGIGVCSCTAVQP